jgi:iron only hydrogenase large subunit-like protein
MAKYQDEINAFSNVLKCTIKSRAAIRQQFSEKEQANAVMLAKMLNKRDVFDTKLGSKMKAITTVDQFLATSQATSIPKWSSSSLLLLCLSV